jgi:phenylalanyl-tRNA synthetase alpha chain
MAIWRVALRQTLSHASQSRLTLKISWHTRRETHILVRGQKFPKDDWTNIPASILTRLDAPSPLIIPNHPLTILKQRIEETFSDFEPVSAGPPIVSVSENFDELGFPSDHPGRSKIDSYYINRDVMLRTHTSAHEVATFQSATPKWLLTADVYRRDEIDASHYPVFHQMEGARSFPTNTKNAAILVEENRIITEYLLKRNIHIEDTSHITSHNPLQDCHDKAMADLVAANLKLSLNRLIVNIFSTETSHPQSKPLRIRWIDAYFPFTSPSFEVEVLFRDKWLEILGCGVVNDSTLVRAGLQ